jgi:folate-binding protein YgfZ
MITDVRLYHRGEWLMAEVGAGRAAELAGRFDGLVFSEDVRVADVSAEYGHFSVIGAEAPSRLARALGLEVARLSGLPVLDQLDIDGGFVARTDDTTWPSFDVVTLAAELNDIVAAVEATGVEPVTAALVEALRVEAGRPSFGTDMTEETIPLEAGLLDRAISTTKGCYVGQEVIIRILDRGGGRVARRLVRLTFEPGASAQPQPGTPLIVEQKEVGRLTSVAFSPLHERFVALGYLARAAAEVGKQVSADVGGTLVLAEVTGLA